MFTLQCLFCICSLTKSFHQKMVNIRRNIPRHTASQRKNPQGAGPTRADAIIIILPVDLYFAGCMCVWNYSSVICVTAVLISRVPPWEQNFSYEYLSTSLVITFYGFIYVAFIVYFSHKVLKHFCFCFVHGILASEVPMARTQKLYA